MLPPLDDVDRIMEVMQSAFPPEYGEAWNRRQVSDALLLAGTHHELIASDGSDRPEAGKDTAGFYLSRGLFDEEELLLFAIAPAHRRKGLGHILLKRFIESARQRNKKRLFLEMRRNNPAGVLYAAHGFQPIGIRPRYYRALNGDRIDAITQELVIE
ncbi:GCN5-related N-acetyltransferase [Novosphingobium nitrogenifigens DSM 19370]|uniref:GCN5-related N-acetyltransferase n=1 Tax=Novosphingobium nitrogenifigens DSM 19370 TaxID=983920 RepID=F1Z754_9SPHN|nr:GNAT family N-acetyltransferase [Novosphingobium nitrogenifigens]EGD59560.1 GCN5-related N-acetyltransferase [Novosphingobium nitrogenifigens DSM 19370]